MTRRPFQPDEAGAAPGELDPVARELERYAELTAGEVPHGLAERVMAGVAEEPTPRRGLLASLLAPFTLGAGGGAVRMAMVAGTVALAVLAVVLAGQLGDLFRDQEIGPSPEPSVVQTPSAPPTPTASPTPSPTASPSPSTSPTASPAPASTQPTATPSGSDDDAETPEPSDDDEVETPEPSDEDNSGPGGGGDDSD